MFTTTPWLAIAAARYFSDGAFTFGTASHLSDAAALEAPAARLSMGDTFLLSDAAQSDGLDGATAARFAGDGNAWTGLYLDPDAGIAAATSGASGTGATSSASYSASRDFYLL